MSEEVDELLQRLAAGRLGWLDQRRLTNLDDPRLIELALQRLAASDDVMEWSGLLRVMVKAIRGKSHLAALATPNRAARLAACLGRGRLTGNEDDLVPYGPVHAVYRSLLAYDQLFQAIGEVALEPLRTVVSGPPLGALVYVNPGLNYLVSILGAKLVCLRSVAEYGDESDAEPLAQLASNLAEDPWTRADAAMIWYRYRPAEALAVIIDQLFTAAVGEIPQGNGSLFPLYSHRLLPLGAELVEPAVARLGHHDFTVRYRATSLLTHLGDPAASALADVVRESDNWHARQNAESALAQIDRGLLKQARADRREAGRGLSLAPEPSGEADRGLSRSSE